MNGLHTFHVFPVHDGKGIGCKLYFYDMRLADTLYAWLQVHQTFAVTFRGTSLNGLAMPRDGPSPTPAGHKRFNWMLYGGIAAGTVIVVLVAVIGYQQQALPKRSRPLAAAHQASSLADGPQPSALPIAQRSALDAGFTSLHIAVLRVRPPALAGAGPLASSFHFFMLKNLATGV
jgi:hypothetical protein